MSESKGCETLLNWPNNVFVLNLFFAMFLSFLRERPDSEQLQRNIKGLPKGQCFVIAYFVKTVNDCNKGPVLFSRAMCQFCE